MMCRLLASFRVRERYIYIYIYILLFFTSKKCPFWKNYSMQKEHQEVKKYKEEKEENKKMVTKERRTKDLRLLWYARYTLVTLFLIVLPFGIDGFEQFYSKVFQAELFHSSFFGYTEPTASPFILFLFLSGVLESPCAFKQTSLTDVYCYFFLN